MKYQTDLTDEKSIQSLKATFMLPCFDLSNGSLTLTHSSVL